MIVDDTADVEQRAWFQLTHFPHELVGLFGIGSATLLVRVEPCLLYTSDAADE